MFPQTGFNLLKSHISIFLSLCLSLSEDKVRRKEAEQQQKLLVQRTNLQQQAIRDLERSNEENIRQLEVKMEGERVRAQAELERVVTAKLKVGLREC